MLCKTALKDRGAAARIPLMHQFVRITEGSIVYGGELEGAKDAAIVDRRASTLIACEWKIGLVHFGTARRKH